MRRSERIEKIIVYMTAVLLCMTLVSLWMISNLYARYSTTTEGGDSARVAVFGHDQSVNLTDGNGMTGLKPGDSRSYTLKVANYRGDTASEVAVKYNVEIVTTGNLPLEYTVYKEDGKQQIGSFTESSENTEKIIKTDDMHFESGTKESTGYVITVQWPDDKTDASYAGIPDDITVNINVEQMD